MMGSKDDGGPAYPTIEISEDQGRGVKFYSADGGLTVRDAFAKDALPIVIGFFNPGPYPYNRIAEEAYAIADAMLIERAK